MALSESRQVFAFVLSFLLPLSTLSDLNSFKLPGDAVDFSGCVEEPDGRCCVVIEADEAGDDDEVLVPEPELTCVHKNVSTCHYTYVTQFRPHQEEVCSDIYTKTCSITFSRQPVVEVVSKCYRPLVTVCDDDDDDDDEDVCKTVHESVCTTRYEASGHKAETRCEKVARELCGPRRCGQKEAEQEECHDKEVTSVVLRPEEVCSLEPRVTCRHVTRMVPRLQPSHVCTVQPREVCHVSRVPRPRVTRPPLTKWCRQPDSEAPGVTRDAAELLRKAKNLGDIQPQKQERPRQQNITPPVPKKTPAVVTENRQIKRPTTPPNKVVSKSTTTTEKKSQVSRVRGQAVINPNIVAPPILQPPPSASSNSISSSNKKSPSRPVFDDILGEVHGADFPQARSKTNYNQNKHGGEHLDNAIADHQDDVGRDKESGDDVRPDTSGRDKANNAPRVDKSREIDHILSSQQLPPSSQFPPPQETFNQVVSETTSISPQSTSVTQTTTTTRKHKPRKGGYLPTNKSHKKSKKKGYLSQKASYLPSNKAETPKSNKGYLPSSGLSLPASPRSPKLLLLSLPPPRSQENSLDDNFPPPREDIGHNNGVRSDAIVNNHNTNDDTHASPPAPNQHRAIGGSKQKKNKSRKKGYLPSSRLSPKKTSSASFRIPDLKDDTDSDRDDASSKRNKQNKNNSSPNKTIKTKPRKSKKIKEEEPHLPRKTDTEQSPFYSLPDSIFDELPEYFRPLPRGLAALIGLSQENQDRRKKY